MAHHAVVFIAQGDRGTGHGAAAWMTHSSDDTSYLALVSSGSLSMRTKCVGTHWLSVILYVSIRRSASSGSNFSIITTVPPKDRFVLASTSVHDDITLVPVGSPAQIPIRGWRQSGKGEKQRTTPAKAKRRKKRK